MRLEEGVIFLQEVYLPSQQRIEMVLKLENLSGHILKKQLRMEIRLVFPKLTQIAKS
jgi:hypothetical protein